MTAIIIITVQSWLGPMNPVAIRCELAAPSVFISSQLIWKSLNGLTVCRTFSVSWDY